MDSSITNMWKNLQTKDKLPKGELMANCESELHELMKQIDIMVSSQKVEWERQMKTTQNRLDIKDKECMAQKNTLQQKHEQIGQLKKKILDMEQSQNSLVDKYETQVSSLRSEVQKVKRDYEKLNKRHVKHTRESERLKEKLSDPVRATPEDRKTFQRHEDYKQKNQDLELQLKILERQVETLESQNKSLGEKCEFAEKQKQTFQSQLDKRRNLQDTAEDSLKNQVSQLETKLDLANESINSQETKTFKLKRNLEEAMNSHKKALDANEKLLEEIKKLKSKLKQSEALSSQQVADLKAKEDLLRMIQEDAQQNTHDISRLEQTLMDKDNIIQSLSDIKRLEEGEQVTLLKDSLSGIQSELKTERKRHKKLNEDLQKMKSKFQVLQNEKECLKEMLQKKEFEVDRLQNVETKKLKSDLEKFQNKLLASQESHRAEMDGVRSQLTSVMTELHNSKADVGKLSDKLLVNNKKIREDSESLEKKCAELQVCYAQIEALRIENRHIRQTVLQQTEKSTPGNLDEEHLNSLQNAYSEALSKLEKENRQLKEDLYHRSTDQTDENFRSIAFDDEVSIQDVYAHDERNITRVRTETVRKKENLQDFHKPAEIQYETNMKLDKPESNRQLHIDVIDSNRRHDILNSSHDTVLSSKAMSLVDSTRDLSVMDDLEIHDSEVSAAERFFSEEEERAQELEKLLDSHMENFKLGTDALIQKYGQNV